MKQDISFLIERKTLLKKLSKWRIFAIILLSAIIILAVGRKNIVNINKPFIAKIKIEGFISDDDYRIKKITSLKNNDNVKAVIIKINSPGGTFVGGERLYNKIKQLAKEKPVVSIIGDQATSAAYLAALGSNYIIGSNGSLTGSVGVLLQAFEATELAEKIGIEPIIIKSSKYKATPHPAEKLSLSDREYLSNIISESNNIFLDIVKNERVNIDQNALDEIALGKVFIGKTAHKINLIDAVGDEDEALKWLENKGVTLKKIINIRLEKQNQNIKKLLQGINNLNFLNEGVKLYSIY